MKYLQWLKRKSLKPKTLYSARLSFRIKGEIKNIPNKWNLRVYHHQTNLVRNVKGPYLSGEEKIATRNKKIYEINRLCDKGTYIIKAVDQSKKEKS